ncbi:hypothetical protein BH23PLA1_BH23PLA1_24090 [soil metagenome]
MQANTRIFVGLLALALLAFVQGCDGGGPSATSSTTEATVNGTVTLDGKPLTWGSLSFDPANVSRPMEAPRMTTIEKDGTYSVTTLVGENTVVVSDVPGAGSNEAYSDLVKTVEVAAGQNQINIDFTSQ